MLRTFYTRTMENSNSFAYCGAFIWILASIGSLNWTDLFLNIIESLPYQIKKYSVFCWIVNIWIGFRNVPRHVVNFYRSMYRSTEVCTEIYELHSTSNSVICNFGAVKSYRFEICYLGFCLHTPVSKLTHRYFLLSLFISGRFVPEHLS